MLFAHLKRILRLDAGRSSPSERVDPDLMAQPDTAYPSHPRPPPRPARACSSQGPALPGALRRGWKPRKAAYPAIHYNCAPYAVSTGFPFGREIRWGRADHALLAGKLFDDRGNRMSPSHAAKGGQRWRYYVSQAVLQGRKHEAGYVARAPALEIEARVAEAARAGSSASNRQGRHELHHPNASGCGASTDSPAVRPSDDDALLRAAIERVVMSRTTIEIELAEGMTSLAKVSQRWRMRSQYTGSISQRRARRPVLWDAISVEPEPANGSSTIPARRETSLIASATIATGLTVGCKASSSSRPDLKVLTPRYCHTLVR